MNRVAEPFQSLLSDTREATQTLANCAAKGALKPDGTRMPPKPRSYESKCENLAAAFLVDHPPYSQDDKEDLAQYIQDAIETWNAAREKFRERWGECP